MHFSTGLLVIGMAAVPCLTSPILPAPVSARSQYGSEIVPHTLDMAKKIETHVIPADPHLNIGPKLDHVDTQHKPQGESKKQKQGDSQVLGTLETVNIGEAIAKNQGASNQGIPFNCDGRYPTEKGTLEDELNMVQSNYLKEELKKVRERISNRLNEPPNFAFSRELTLWEQREEQLKDKIAAITLVECPWIKEERLAFEASLAAGRKPRPVRPRDLDGDKLTEPDAVDEHGVEYYREDDLGVGEYEVDKDIDERSPNVYNAWTTEVEAEEHKDDITEEHIPPPPWADSEDAEEAESDEEEIPTPPWAGAENDEEDAPTPPWSDANVADEDVPTPPWADDEEDVPSSPWADADANEEDIPTPPWADADVAEEDVPTPSWADDEEKDRPLAPWESYDAANIGSAQAPRTREEMERFLGPYKEQILNVEGLKEANITWHDITSPATSTVSDITLDVTESEE